MRNIKKLHAAIATIETFETRQLFSAGGLDTTFGSGGVAATTQFQTASAGLVAVDPTSGNAFVSGQSVVNHSISNGFLEEFNSKGALDPSFGTGGVLSPILPTSTTSFFEAGKVLVQPDGKILLIGASTPSYTTVIVRLNANGSPDSTFGTNGIESLPFSDPSAFALQSNGDIVVADISTANATIYRLTPTGQTDTTFGTGGSTVITVPSQTFSQVNSFAFDASGQIIASGFYGPGPNGFAQVGLVARLNTNGTLDTTFNGTGYVTDPIFADPEDEENTPVLVATTEPDGTILTASSSGFGENSANTILFNRYNSDGTPDSAFGTNGQITSSIVIGQAYNNQAVYAVAQSDGKIVLASTAVEGQSYTTDEYELIRINADGSLDNTFGNGGYAVGTMPSEQTTSLAISPTGQFYANVNTYYTADPSAAFDNPPIRFNSNGSIDTTYGDDGFAIGVPNFESGEALAVLPNGQSLTAGIVVVGNQTGIYVKLYNNDGSLDTTFAPGAGLGGSNGYAFLGINNQIPPAGQRDIGIEIDSQGRIVVGANFANGEFFRLNANGTVDTTFGTDGIATPIVNGGGVSLEQFTLDSSDRIVATVTGSTIPVIRLTATGALDSSFGANGEALADPKNSVGYQSNAVAIASNGQILIGESAQAGYTGTQPFTPQLAVARLNSNGSIDTTFGTAGLATAPLHSSSDKAAATTLTILANGDILAGGAETFASTGGISVVLARFLSTGKLDTTFGTAGEYAESTSPIALQIENTNNILVESDGKLLVTGTYLYAGHAQTQEYSITRLTANGVLDSTFGNSGHVYTNPSNAGYPSNYLLNSAITPNGDLEVIGNFYQGFELVEYQLGLPAGTGSVSGTVFSDTNGDGVQQTGETGLAGVTVYDDVNNTDAYASGDPSTTTSSSGTYLLNGLLDRSAIIRIVPGSGNRQSFPGIDAPQTVSITSTPTTGANFGVTSRLYVSGTVTTSGAPQGNAVVYADLNNDGKFESGENNKTTASDGSFAFQSLTAGTYTFRVVAPAGYVQSVPANNAGITVTLGAGGIVQNLAFSFVPQSATNKLSGTIIGTAGSYQNDGNTIAKAFDGILTNYFDGPTANGNYAGLNLGSPKNITEIGFDPRTGYASRMVGGVFQVSNSADFSNALTIYTVNSAPASDFLTTVQVLMASAYQYIRYVAPNGSYGDVGELEFFGTTPTSTGPTKLTGTVIGTSGSYQNDGNTIAKAFDGILTNYFDGPVANGDYAGLDLGSAQVVTQVGFDPRDGFSSRMVGGIFQGSNSATFSNAVTLYTITSAPPSDTLTTVSLTNTQAFEFVRYLAPNGSYGDVGELAFYGG